MARPLTTLVMKSQIIKALQQWGDRVLGKKCGAILACISLRDISAALGDLTEGMRNEEGVLTRNAEVPLDRVPTAEELSYKD
jgi:hypothetical protein